MKPSEWEKFQTALAFSPKMCKAHVDLVEAAIKRRRKNRPVSPNMTWGWFINLLAYNGFDEADIIQVTRSLYPALLPRNVTREARAAISRHKMKSYTFSGPLK